MLNAIRVLLPFLKPYRGKMFLVLISILIVSGAGLLAPWLVRELVRVVRLAEGDLATASQSLTSITVALLVVYMLRSAGQFINFHVSHVVAFGVVHDLQVAVYEQLQRFSPGYFADRQTGEIVSRVVKDTVDVEPVIADVVYDFVVSFLLAVGIIIVLLTLNPGLTLLALLPVPFALGAVLLLALPMQRAFRQEGEDYGAMSGLVQDNVSGIKEIQVFNREQQELARVQGVSGRYAGQSIQARKLTALLFPSIEGATGMSIILVVWFGGRQALDGTIPVEDLVAFVLYLTTFYQPLWLLLGTLESLQRGMTGVNRIDDVLKMAPEVDDPPQGVDPGRLAGRVSLDGVHFAYREGMDVLHDITFTIQPGQTLALVGPTGAGKSTVVSLVARFYDPQAGQVRIDGVDLREMRLGALRRNLSIVLQDVFLFNGTVRENIRFGRPHATDEDILAAAQVANAHEFILALPNGYDTLIGERGVKLSGGQKQRLSIARAVLKDAPILILDEATSSVDTETEAQIQEALERLMAGRTAIVIAHRLSTVRNADQIIVLDDGRVVERGSHEEIVSENGLYARLVARQSAALIS
ncbi:MAG: ABC transporter ATP-binding protein [Anaerolineales bacterium]